MPGSTIAECCSVRPNLTRSGRFLSAHVAECLHLVGINGCSDSSHVSVAGGLSPESLPEACPGHWTEPNGCLPGVGVSTYMCLCPVVKKLAMVHFWSP